jgi:signal transduction histidine kinase
LAVHLNDSLSKLRIQNLKNFQVLSFTKQKRLEEINTERKNKLVRWTAYISIVIALLVGLIALFAYRNARLRKKTNLALLEQKQALESTLEKLKSTQSQLIQSEKMASLGELTAGIAHEIQNPLNFVNNFAELNTELHSELQEALQKGDQKEAEELSYSMQENEKKILLHGKRAGAIVKSMLEHSQGSKGTMEPTDLNKLTAEYLRLAYHGFKAKHEDQSLVFQLHEQKGLPPVPAVPQDLGKVLLNLFSNAFYAVNQKTDHKDQEPKVIVSTSMEGGRVSITVKDNGTGIPESIKHKIFQPFFTTKPTGEGTGLGLSLSYDIVKAHGGEIRVESKEGEGSTFTLVLPVPDDKSLLS